MKSRIHTPLGTDTYVVKSRHDSEVMLAISKGLAGRKFASGTTTLDNQ